MMTNLSEFEESMRREIDAFQDNSEKEKAKRQAQAPRPAPGTNGPRRPQPTVQVALPPPLAPTPARRPAAASTAYAAFWRV